MFDGVGKCHLDVVQGIRITVDEARCFMQAQAGFRNLGKHVGLLDERYGHILAPG